LLNFLLYYSEKYKKKAPEIEKEEVSKVQACYNDEDEDDDEYEKYDRRNGNYLF